MEKKLISLIKWAVLVTIFAVTAALSAPYAAIVIDAGSGEVLHKENADTRLHPAGLTKLITLYAAFDAIETGLIGLDDTVRVSSKAANEPAVTLGLREGQRITVNDLVRASGAYGANDASTALAVAIDGSEQAFARRLNGFSSELGLTRSSWQNAHGLTEKAHLSSAHDVAKIFAAHHRDFPQYFHIFRNTKTTTGLRKLNNSSAFLLTEINGIEGAKYGYTRAASFSGATYVRRRDKALVAVIFGAQSKEALVKKMSHIINNAFHK